LSSHSNIAAYLESVYGNHFSKINTD